MPGHTTPHPRKIRLLIVEDNLRDAEINIRQLREAGFDPEWKCVDTEADYLAALEEPCDVILSDFTMPRFDGVRAVELLRQRGLDIPFILLSGTMGEAAAVAAMKEGATDYLLKGNIRRLGYVVDRALDEKNRRDAHRQTEKALHASERLHSAIVAAALDCIITIDREGRITEFNPAAEKTFGHARADVMGKPMAELIIPPRLRTAHASGLARLLATGEGAILGQRLELSALRADGTEFPVELTVARLTQTAPPSFTAFVRDITPRREAEEGLRRLHRELEQRVADRTTKLEAANKELDDFAHSVSHDLRAPLRAISGFGQFLAEECGPALGDSGGSHLRRILQSAHQMGALIDSLLEFARASRAELRRVPVDLSAMMLEVAREQQQAQPLRHVHLECAPGLRVPGDPVLLRTVLTNLLGNAWKYTGKIAEARIEFGGTIRDEQCCCFIRDNGVGFDMQYVHRLFGPFQRLHSQSEFEGSGVGLATVQRIIHRHGGKVWAEAERNVGATFFFTLPLHESSEPIEPMAGHPLHHEHPAPSSAAGGSTPRC